MSTAESAFNSAKVDSINISRFEADLGWSPKTLIKLLSGIHDELLQSVTELKRSLQESLRSATFAQRLAQARQGTYNSKSYEPPSYKVGDKVFLSYNLFTGSSSTARTSPTLDVRGIGPFKPTEIINENEICLKSSDSTNIHPILHVEHMTRVYRQPTDISFPPAVPPRTFVDDTGEIVTEVSEILTHGKRGRCFQSLTLFKNTPRHEAGWKLLKGFLDPDGTITEALHTCIDKNGNFPHLH